MPRIIFIFCLILLGGCSNAPSSYFSQLDRFFELTKALEHQEAEIELEALVLSENVKNELGSLNQKLLFGVQGNKEKFKIKEPSAMDTPFLKCIKYLNNGYFELYFNPDKSLAYENFHKALELSTATNYLPLRKFCLISLLEYFHTEIARNDKNYLRFLRELEGLGSDQIDTIWITIYKLIFQSAYVDELDENYYVLAKKLDVFEEELGADHPLISRIYFEKALNFELEENWEEAKTYYEKAFESSKDNPSQSYLSFSSIIKTAEYYKNIEEPGKALKKLGEVQGYLNPNDAFKDEFYISKYKSSYLKETGDCCIAYEELERSNSAGYQLDFRRNSLEISRLQVQLETQKKALENTKLRNQLYLVLLALVIGSIVFVLLQKNTHKKRVLAEQQQLIERQKVENLLKEQELTSIDAMIEGQERERQKVANELHDDLGSIMATIKLHFDNLKVDEKEPGLKNAQKLLAEAYQKIRGMAHSKNSGVMSDQGLLPALKKMAHVITESNALLVTVEDFGMGERLENSMELTLFRMVQELVTNTIKHAHATKLHIQLTQHEDQLNIIVEDNGKGFDRAKVDTNNIGMGLTNIEKRVEHLEGSFTVDSIVGKGTSILIDIPV